MKEMLLVRLGALVWLAPAAAAIWLALAVLAARLKSGVPPEVSPTRRSLWTDLGYFAISPISEALSRLLSTCGLALCALAIGRDLGPQVMNGFGWVAEQPRLVLYLEVLVLGDLIFYWTHRLAHAVPWLWRLHAVHHSTRHMRATSAIRAHPGEAYAQLIQMIPLYFMGFPLEVLLSVLPFAVLYAMFIHSSFALRLGPLRYVLNSPAFHRWHHALDISHGTKNFSGWFPVFDLMFGSFTMPQHDPPELGIDDREMPETFGGQLLYPFRRSSKGASHWKQWTAHTS